MTVAAIRNHRSISTLGTRLQGLEAAFNAQRRFVANASHELRTPLATIRASLDVAVAKPEGAPAQTIALAARLRAELDRINSLLAAAEVVLDATGSAVALCTAYGQAR